METTGFTMPKNPWVLVAIVGAALLAFIGLWAVFANIGVTNDGNKMEARLTSAYSDNQNVLSDCVVKIRETANVTGAEADKFEEVMVETIKGRYDGRSPDPGSMFSAIVEDYPDLAPLSKAYERVHNVIMQCRTDFKGYQSKLLDELAVYKSWRTGSWTVRTFGGEFPSQNLEARIGSDVAYGREALDRMYTIVVVKDVNDSYDSGELVPEDPFGSS